MIADSIIEEIGDTPLVRLNDFYDGDNDVELAAKLELFNPISIKDRPVLSIIEEGERKGEIDEDTTIIEATSGNTGMALSYICAIKGYDLVICMNEEMSEERKGILRAFGADLELTPPEEHTWAAKKRAMALADEIDNSFYVNQHGNPANTRAHVETTAEEIWEDTDGDVDIVVAALGTTGTAMGLSKALKAKNPDIQVIGVEPEKAPKLSNGSWDPHDIPGTSPGFVPDLYEEGRVDEIIQIDGEEEAYDACQQIAKTEGMLVGISSGATAAAAKQVADREENDGKLVVSIFADSGQRYLSVEDLFF